MYGTGDSQTAQKWFRLVERVVNDHLSEDGRVYFLSGTPHQGNREVFLNLVAMMCGLGRQATQQEQERALAGRIIYRTKEEVHDWDDRPVFPKRDIRTPRYAENPPEYNGLLDDIAKFFDWLQASGGGIQGRALGFVKSHALQYAASSPESWFRFPVATPIALFRRRSVREKVARVGSASDSLPALVGETEARESIGRTTEIGQGIGLRRRRGW